MPYGVRVRNGGTWVYSSLYVRNGGQWKLSNIPYEPPSLYPNELVIYITSNFNFSANNNNVSAKGLFESAYPGSWNYDVPKKLIVNPGAVVGATDTYYFALNIDEDTWYGPSGSGRVVYPSSLVGSFTLDNYGQILGAGAAPDGIRGGTAIVAASQITINNYGLIYGGGGSGTSGAASGATGYGGYGWGANNSNGALSPGFNGGGSGGFWGQPGSVGQPSGSVTPLGPAGAGGYYLESYGNVSLNDFNASNPTPSLRGGVGTLPHVY